MATEIVMPRLSDSMEEGTVLQWLVAEGDLVSEGTPIVEVETDKASVTYESETGGTVLSIAVPAGASAGVGAVIAVVGDPGEAAAPGAPAGAVAGAGGRAAPPAARPAARPAPAGMSAGHGAARPERIKASPLARRIAVELGVDLSTLAGTGPQGRVVRSDVERSASAAAAAGNGGHGIGVAEGAATTAPAAGGESAGPGAAAGRESAGPGAAAGRESASLGARGETERRPLTRMQQTIARRMAESRATIPDFELRAEVDMTELVTLREQLRAATDLLPSYNDFIVKAAALALRELPRVNGSYRDGEHEAHGRVNVGIAVAAEDALVVPTIFDADRLSVAQIAAASRDLAARVRDGSITPAELSGSTFSVSNLGMYGVDSFSAVINPPQAAILAVGSVRPRPVVTADGAIVARRTVNLSLACDHRVLYGADGARFLARLRELLEGPLALLVR